MAPSTILVGKVPVALRAPDAHLQHELAATRAVIAETRRRLTVMQAVADAAPARRDHLARIIEGLAGNLALAETQERILAGHVKDAPASAPALPYGLINLEYLRLDWTDTRECLEQVARVVPRLQAIVHAHVREPDGRAAVLGAGTGRFAFELAPLFRELVAIELCYAYAHFFHELIDAPVTFYELNLLHPMSLASSCRRHRAAMPPARDDRLSRMRLIVADARDLPVEDHALAAVFSIYFTDVLPPSELLPELRRVLRPGGKLVHFGPLHWHFADRNPYELLAPEELLAVFAAAGFRLLAEDALEMPFHPSDARTRHDTHHVWEWVFQRE